GRNSPYLSDSVVFSRRPRRPDMAHVAGARLPPAQDFDFFMCRWTVHNRRLTERLAGSDEWEEFESTSVAHPILGGLGNEDEFRPGPAGGVLRPVILVFHPP